MAAAAQPTAPPPSNDDCLTCHGDATAVRGGGTSVFVDQAAFARSVHGQVELQCIDCHADLKAAELPHAEKLAPVDCGTCHDQAVAAFATSIHAGARTNGKTTAATCVSCHGMHDILPSKDPASSTYHLNLPRTCAGCHADPKIVQPRHDGDPNPAVQFADSIHGRALTHGGLLVAPSCATCHGAHDIREASDAQSHVFRARVPDTCGTCHEGIRLQYGRGIHGKQVEQGDPQAPICSDCHTAHNIQRAETGWRLDVIKECGTCHSQSLSTYRDTFHGQATELGFARVAMCADCHGAHEILPASDPRSAVAPAGRLATCRKCHTDANANFAAYDPHADPHDRGRNPALYYASRFMQILLAAVFTFFGAHSTLWFVRSWQSFRQRRRHHDATAPAASTGQAAAASTKETHGPRV